MTDEVYTDVNGGVSPLADRIKASEELLAPRLALMQVEAECREKGDLKCQKVRLLWNRGRGCTHGIVLPTGSSADCPGLILTHAIAAAAPAGCHPVFCAHPPTHPPNQPAGGPKKEAGR